MTKIYRDHNGVVVNIGEWDFQEESYIDEKTGRPMTKINNPLPEGLTTSEEEVVKGWDGGLYSSEDPRKDGDV